MARNRKAGPAAPAIPQGNAAFITARKTLIMDDARVTNDPVEAHCIGFNMWVNAVTQAGTTAVDRVSDATIGQTFPNLTGGTAEMLANHPLTKPALIGEIRADGQFDIISQTEPVPGDARTDFLPESAVPEADWKDLKCGMLNTETKTCVQLTANCQGGAFYDADRGRRRPLWLQGGLAVKGLILAVFVTF